MVMGLSMFWIWWLWRINLGSKSTLLFQCQYGIIDGVVIKIYALLSEGVKHTPMIMAGPIEISNR